MSTQQQAQATVVCNYSECQQRGPKWEFHHGKYCSSEHEYRDLGSDILDAIRHDHTVCSTCYRFRKQIEKPPEHYRRQWSQVIQDAVVGFEYPTEDLHVEGGMQYCTCGTTSHYDDNGFLKTSDLKTTLVNLLAVVETHREKEEHDHSVDADELLNALQKQSQEGGLDWELALGRAVQ